MQARRPLFTVDKYHVVALAEPVVGVALEAVYVQVGAAVDLSLIHIS